MTPVVLARGLSQRFGKETALGPLDLRVEAGERLAVLGENGAGKTTLLRLLATAARPAAGQLELFGRDAQSRRERLRPRLGYLGHQPGLYPSLTARENLELFATLHGLGRSAGARALAAVGLEGLCERRVERLSRGQQQRLGLARTVLHEPELLLLDEPDASLDEGAGELLRRLVGERTLILATHDLDLARDLCGRALRLRAGREVGDPWGRRPAEPLRVVGS